MSQYPPSPYSPYTPPQPNLSFDYYRPAGFGGPGGLGASPQNLLAPARRASVLMFVLGGLALLFAGCMGMVAATNPFEKMPPEQTQAIRDAEAKAGISVQTVLAVFCAVTVVVGAAFIALGVWVRRGSGAAAITATILTALVTLHLGIFVLAALAQAASNPETLMSACIFALATAACVVLIVWLIQATKAATVAAAVRQQFAAQYWQSQQQQQAYGQGQNPYGAYGYPGAAYPPGQQASGGYGYGYGQQQSAYPPGSSGGTVPPGTQDNSGAGESRGQ